MGKKAQAQKEIPPRKNAEGSSRTAKPPVTNPQSAAATVTPTSTVPHQPAVIPANVPPQGVAELSVPLSQVIDLLKLANLGVYWGMAMATMGLAAQNPPITTIPPAVTVPTPTVTSPIPTTENPNQPPNRAVEPGIPEPSSPEKIETPQTVLDVSPVSVYKPPTAEPKIDEEEGGERDEGEEGRRRETEEGEGVEESDPKKEEEKKEEELDGHDKKDVGNEDEHEDVGGKEENLENEGNVNLEEEEIVDERTEGEMGPEKKNEWPFRVIRYNEETVMGDGSWESAVAVPEDTPPIKIRAKFLAALPKFSGSENKGPWGTLNRFLTVCWRRRLQIDIPEDIFQMGTFPYCLSGEAATWFKSLAPGSTTTWRELENAFLRKFANGEELDAPAEAWFNWSIAKAKWAASDHPNQEDMPTLEAEVAKFNEAKEQQDLQREAATNRMWNMAEHQILGGQMADDPEFEEN